MWQYDTHCGYPKLLAKSVHGSSTHTIKALTKIIGVIPLEPNLEIVVLNDQSLEPFKGVLALSISQTIDGLDMVSDSEDGFPASDGVSADDWVLGFEH
jgi:hypothetical protein